MINLPTLKENKKISAEPKTCAAVLVNKLIELGVNSIFGYPGASVLSIYNELSKTEKITHYLVRHEQAALHAAEGYARVSGKVGVVLVTSGPGFTNTITGIANAYADSTPLVVFAGDVTKEYKNGKIFQNLDILSMTKSCTKKTFVLSRDDDIAKVTEEAFYLANSGVKGPVVIVLPRNIIEAKYTFKKQNFVTEKQKKENHSAEIKKLISLIKSSVKPLILAGGGAINSSEEILTLVQKTGIPVVSTLMGIGVLPSDNSNYLGMIGANGTYAANTALANCDLLISLGVSFSDRTTCKNKNFAKNAKIVNVNISEISRKFELKIREDIKHFLNSFLQEQITTNELKRWHEQIKTYKEEGFAEAGETKYLHSSYVLKTISEYTKDKEPIVVTDVGQHQMLTAQFFKFNKPNKFITSGGLGAMGFGLPAAMGAYIANPNNLVINITGDGSYQMNLQELATCREHNIPVKIIIMNNGYLGMVRQMQEKIYKNRYQVEMTNPDFTKIAEAYDLFAVRVSDKSELIPALKKAITHNGTAIIDIAIDSFEEI